MNEVLSEMLHHYALKEVLGPESNPEILEMFKAIGYGWVEDDATAWCSAALNYFCLKCGYERSGKLDARSWLNLPIQVLTPQQGDVVIFWRGDPKGWEGHVGLFIASRGENIFTLGGNQSDSICILPYPKNRVLGYRQIRKLTEI
jgi:uncharacterized protein (TIGR02594 family)